MNESSDMDFGSEVSRAFLAKVFMAAFGFAGTIIFARLLGPAGVGGFYLLFTLVNLASRPLSGFAVGCQKRFSEVTTDSGSVLTIALGTLLVVALIGAIGAYLTQDLIRSYTGVPHAAGLFTVLFGATALYIVSSALLSGQGRIGLSVWLDFSRSVVTLVGQVALVVVIGLGAAGLVYGLAAATALFGLIGLVILGIRPTLPSYSTLRSLLSYARYSIPSNVVSATYIRLDVLLLGIVFTPAVVGTYEVAARLTVPAVMLSTVLTTGLITRASNLDSRNESPATDVTNALSFSSLFAIPLLFGALALADPLVLQLFRRAFSDSALFLIGLALYQIVASQSTPMTGVLNGLDKPDRTFRIGSATLLFNIILGTALIFAIGPLGVVIATICAETLRYGLLRRAVRNELPTVDFVTPLIRKQVLAATVMFAIVYATRFVVDVYTPVGLGVAIAVGIVTYGGLLWMSSPQIRETAAERGLSLNG